MFTRVLTSALFAGVATGVLAAVLQLVFVQPVLLQAELFESGQLTHSAAAPTVVPAIGFAFDPLRDGLSVLFTMLIYTGYALILIPAMAVAEDRGAAITPRAGLIWGVAGFAAVQLAPAFGLAPEVPGVAAADLAARQVWWFATVGMTAAALWLLAFGRGRAAWGAAIVLALAPHAIGAPLPDALTGPAPTEIGALFVSRALGVGLVAWAVLGLCAAYFWQREGLHQPQQA
jgi:cobalt transporter subunit CbtA